MRALLWFVSFAACLYVRVEESIKNYPTDRSMYLFALNSRITIFNRFYIVIIVVFCYSGLLVAMFI